jgi:hypothetical protein
MKVNLILLLFLLFTSARVNAQVYGSVIENWDFSDGIPNDWENASSSGISQWEYRGPNTTPSNLQGSLGSCGGSSVPIVSPSASNGFVMFDANYWDDPIGPCGNLGSGADPAPHLAWLTTGIIDLGSENSVVLTFRQQFNHFNTTTRVLASIDGGETWDQVFINPTTPSALSGPGIWSSVNISALVANQPTVKLKFEFSGTYYWWMLDDITLYRPNTNDLLLHAPKYTLFDNTLEPDGLGDMEYSMYPQAMLPPFNFQARVTNIGAEAQSGVTLNVAITDESNNPVYEANSSAIGTLAAGSESPLIISQPYIPAPFPNQYTITYTVNQEEEEETPENNSTTKTYRVTPFYYGFDRGPVEDVFTPPAFLQGQAYEIGGLYQARANGLQLHGLSAALAGNTQPGAEIYGVVYNHRRDSLLGISDPYIVNSFDINSVGEEKLIHLNFQEPIITHVDSVYAVLIGSTDTENGLFQIGRNGAVFEQGCIVRFPNINQIYFLLRAPIVRARIFASNQTPGCTDEAAANYSSAADTDDGSCIFPGCTDPEAINYDPDANFAAPVCQYVGCTDPEAANFDPQATIDDGSCVFLGCTDEDALNFDPTANTDDGSCVYGQAFLSSSPIVGCVPFAVTFNNLTSIDPGGECFFTLNGEPYSNECLSSFTIEFNEPGSYTLEYEYITEGISTVFTVSPILIGTAPEAPSISYDAEEQLLTCEGFGENAIEWFFNAAPLPNSEGSTHVPEESGTYNAVVTNSFNCATGSNPIFVLLPGAVASLASEVTAGCGAPFSASLTNETLTEPGSTCQLSVNGVVVSNECNASYLVSLPEGENVVTLTHAVSDSITTSSVSITVVENPPVPQLSYDANTGILACTNCGDFNLTWFFNQSPLVGEENASWQPAESGTYSVMVTDQNGCTSMAVDLEVIVTSVDEFRSYGIVVYPNPAQETIHVRSIAEIQRIELYAMDGRQVAVAIHPGGEPVIPVRHLTQGVYLVIVHTAFGSTIRKIQVVR